MPTERHRLLERVIYSTDRTWQGRLSDRQFGFQKAENSISMVTKFEETEVLLRKTLQRAMRP